MTEEQNNRQALADAAQDAHETFGEAPVGQYTEPCPEPRLVKLTVVSGAVQVSGGEPLVSQWATVRRESADVIVKATTDPNTEETWKRIVWSGDVGRPIPGRANQRALPRDVSVKLRVEAELNGFMDVVEVWILWAEVTILTSGPRPQRAPPYIDDHDEPTNPTHQLGAVLYDDGRRAQGKMVAVATLFPKGVGSVVANGWNIRREMQGHYWSDGKPYLGHDRIYDGRWFSEPRWANDDSQPPLENLDPGPGDDIYDTDAPDIAPVGVDDAEVDANFRQWVEWNAKDKQSGGSCSDFALWHWEARWKSAARPQVVLANVGPGNVKHPNTSFFHPHGREIP